MSDVRRIQTRIRRRETHSPRSGVAIVVAALLILALAYVATEIAIAAAGGRALLVSPAGMVADLVAVPAVATAILASVGGAAIVVGVGLLIVALAPGRRARHVQPADRAVVVVDDAVIASALVRVAADTADIDPDRAVGVVSRRRAVVRITPSSGRLIDRAVVTAALREGVEAWGLSPALTPSVVIEKTGRVGA